MFGGFVFTLIVVPGLLAPLPGWPTGTVAVGPDGVTLGPADEYYLMVNLTQPELPHEAAPTDDCNNGNTGPETTPDAVAEQVTKLFEAVNAAPTQSPSPYLPGCIPVPVGACTPLGCQPPLYASYNVSSGRYYVESGGTGAILGMRAGDFAVTGTTGGEVKFDCVGCPPW